MGSNLLTKSRLAAARSCQRQHDILYQQGYRPVEEANALSFGTLVHKGLEFIWTSGSTNQVVLDGDLYDMARATAMLKGYIARWHAEDVERYEVLSVEQEFDCPLVNPATGATSKTWRLAGKLDVLVRDRTTGHVWIVEHKTSSSDIGTGSAYWARLRMDTQASIYYAGAQSLGYEPAGIIWDVLAKPRLRPLEANSRRATPETPTEFQARIEAAIAADHTPYYQRGEVVRLEAEMADAMTDIWQTGQQLRDAERLGRSPRNPDACEKWGRLCDFFPVCSGEETLDNQRLYQLSTKIHPELTGHAKEERHGNTETAAAP